MGTLECCKLYPKQRRGEAYKLARLLRGGGWILRAIAGLDRWLSKQNPAYRPSRISKAPNECSLGAFEVKYALRRVKLLRSKIRLRRVKLPLWAVWRIRSNTAERSIPCVYQTMLP